MLFPIWTFFYKFILYVLHISNQHLQLDWKRFWYICNSKQWCQKPFISDYAYVIWIFDYIFYTATTISILILHMYMCWTKKLGIYGDAYTNDTANNTSNYLIYSYVRYVKLLKNFLHVKIKFFLKPKYQRYVYIQVYLWGIFSIKYRIGKHFHENHKRFKKNKYIMLSVDHVWGSQYTLLVFFSNIHLKISHVFWKSYPYPSPIPYEN